MPNPEDLLIAEQVGVKALEGAPLGLVDLLGPGERTMEGLKDLFRVSLATDDVAYDRLMQMGATRLDLASGHVDGITDFKVFEGSTPKSGLAVADLTTASGATRPVFLHLIGGEDRIPWSWGDRIRRQPAAQFISTTLFDTVPKSVVRGDLVVGPGVFSDGSVSKMSLSTLHSFDGTPQIQVAEDAGRSLDLHPALDKNERATFAQIESKPPAARAFEKAVVEREILGDDDPNLGNFTLSGGLYRPSFGNIDLQYAFGLKPEPVWDGSYAFHDLAGQPLRRTTLYRISRAADSLDTTQGRSVLRNLQLTEPEIDGVLSRINSFLEKRTFPELTPRTGT